MSSNIDNQYNSGAALGQSLYGSTIGTDFENFNDLEDTADINALDYDSLLENSVPFDDVAQDAPAAVSDDMAPETMMTPNILNNIETGADSSTNRVEVSPEMRELFDSGESEKIQAEAIDEINNSEPSPELRELMNNKTPEELQQMARDGIAENEPSPELKKLYRPIQEIPKEVIMRVDDLSRRTGYPKKYIMQNLEEVAAKADEKDYEDFIATKTGPLTQEHLRYPYNRARMRNEFALLTLEPELQRLENLGKVYDAYSQILQMKALNPDFNDLQAQYNFWHQEYPDGVQRGKAMQEFKPYVDDLENKFWEDQEDYEQAYLRYKGMKEKGSWVPNSIFNFLTAGAYGHAGTQNIVEEIGSYLTGEDIQLGKYSGDRYQKQLEMAIEMFNQDSPDNWISPEWYQRGRNILESLSTAVKGTASAGISGASVLFGLDAFSQGADAARAAGLNAGDLYDFAAREAFTEFGYNMLGGKVFGAGVESMLNKAFTDIGEKGLVQAFKEYGPNGIKSALKNSGANILEENLEEVATEVTHAVNEVLSGVDPTALSADKLVPRLKETVIQSSIMSGAPGGVEVGRALLVNRAHKNFMADMSQERVKKVDAAVKSSKLLKEDPQELERYLQITVPSLKALQVDSGVIVDTYAQSKNDFETDMQELGLSPDEVRDQAELGIKATIAAPKILTSEAGRRLLETVGLDSVNEIGVESTVEARKATEQLKKDIIKIKEDIAAEEREDQARHEFLENIADVAKFQGLYKKGDTRQMNAVWNAALENIYRRAGMTAEEFFKDVNLEVEESYARAVSNYEMGKNKYIDLSKLTERQKAAIIRARRNELEEGSAERVAAQEQEQFEKILYSEAVNSPIDFNDEGNNQNTDNFEDPEAQRYILTPDGDIEWGTLDFSKINPDIKRKVPIYLKKGYHGEHGGFGLIHMKRGNKIGGNRADLIKELIDNHDKVYVDERVVRGKKVDTIVLVKENLISTRSGVKDSGLFLHLIVNDNRALVVDFGENTEGHLGITTQFEPSNNKQKEMREVWSSRDTFSDTNRVSTHSTSSDTADIISHSPQPDENVNETESLSQTSENVLKLSNDSKNNIPHDTKNVNNENTDKGNSDEVDRLEQDKDLSPKNPRGWLATTKDGKKILHLSKNADASTLMHEMMHLYIDRAMLLLDSGRGSEDFRRDIQALVEFAEGVAGKELSKKGNEKIARAFEAYLMEGKAPSAKLVNAFNSFKKWLTGIYRSIKSLNVELNDDVRGVFDRMLATEEEIERAHSQYYPLKELLVDMYETDKEKADEIRKLHKQVKTTAEEKLLRRAMKNWKLLKGGIGQIRKDARAEIEQEKVYSKSIPAAISAGGLNLEEVTAQYGAEAAEKLRKHSSSLIKKSGKVSFDSPELFEIAAENDLTPEQFVEKLIATPKLTDKVNENVAQKIAAKEAELRQNLEEGENGDLLHSDSQLLLKMAEYDLLMNTINKHRPSINNQRTELSAVNNAAREVLEKETSSVASCYYKYSQAEKRAGRDARKALSLAADTIDNIINETERKKRYAGKNQDTAEYKRLQDRVNLAEAVRSEEDAGKRQKLDEKLRRQIQGEAATYVYREMLNHALVLEAVKSREMVKGVIKKYGRRKIDATTKNVENEYRDTIYAIARKFKLIPEGRVTTHSMTADNKNRNRINPVVGSRPVQQADNDGNVDLTQLPEQLKDMLPDDLILPDWIAREALPESYRSVRDLTIEQVKELDQVMGELIQRGKTTLDVIKIQGAETTEQAVNASIESMETLDDKYDRDDKLFFKTSLNKEEIKLSAKSLYDTTLNWLRRIGAHMNIMDFIAIKADGYQVLQRTHEGKKGGAFFGPMQTIVNTAAKLDAEYAEKFTKIKTDLRPHLEVLETAKKRLAKRYGAERFKIPMLPVPEILKKKRGREYWDTEMLLMCALDLGNAKNEYALMEGYEFMPSQIEQLKHQFTSEEWTAIQGIWDVYDSLFEPLDAVNFRLTNRHLVKEEAKPFTVYTADGETIEVKGGYGPLKYDTKLSARPAQYAEVEAMLSGKSGTYTSAVGTKMGMTKARLVDEEGNPVVPYPPSLSLSAVLQPHLRDTLRVITHAEFINEVDKITSNEDWQDTFIRKFGFDNYKEVRDWIGRLARPSRKIQGATDKAFDWIKNRNTQLALGFRFKTGVKQRLSIFNGINAMGDDGLYWLLQGYKNVGMGTGLLGTGTGVYGKDRVSEQVKAINELSPVMRVRADNISREISDYLGNLTHSKRQFNILGHKFGWDDVRESAFWWIKVNDLSAVYPLWQGAFMQAMDKNSKLGVIDRSELKDGMSEDEIGEIMQKWQKQAAEYADYIISSTQPSTLPSALSGLQSQEGILRFFTSFMTFTLKAGNRLGMYYGAWRAGKISKATMIKHVMVEWIAPAMSMLGLAALCYNGDDEPEWTDWAFAVPESMLATVPLARNVSAGVKYRANIFELPGVDRISDLFTRHDLQSFLLFGELAAGVPAMNIYRDATKEYKKISGDKEK